jgi:glycine oxidase
MARALLSGVHIGVVGAGVIGLSCARELIARGARVDVYDRGRAGEGASSAAAGMLAAAAEILLGGEGPARHAPALARESLELWPRFAAELARDTGRELGFRQDGAILPALDDEHDRGLRAAAARAHAHGLALEPLEPREARAREPGLSNETRFALYAPEDWSVDARALVGALAASVRGPGGGIAEGVEIADVEPGASPRLVGRSAAGVFDAAFDAVVVAAGWRAAELAGRFPDLARLVPVKGQMLAVAAGSAAPRHVIRGRAAYLVPRADGRVLIGATSEPGVATTTVDAAAVDTLRAAAVRLVPALEARPVVETWAGVRPGLGPSPGHGADGEDGPIVRAAAPGVVIAVGHHRNGVLLAPATAVQVAELVAGVSRLTKD